MQGKITIKDVAKRAGVSPATVTRVLKGGKAVKESTRKKVLSALEDLGYSPDIFGRSLRGGKTGILGVDIPHSLEHFYYNFRFVEILRAINDEVFSSRTSVYFFDRERNYHGYATYKDLLEMKLVDGVVICNPPEENEVYELLLGENFPFVVLGKPPHFPNRITYIATMDREIAREAVNYLIKKGRRKIAMINPIWNSVSAEERLKGYREAIEEAGLKFNPELVRSSPESLNEAFIKTVELLLHEKVDAIFAGCDLLALGVFKAAKKMGMRIPEDLAVIGVNDSPFLEKLDPPLTSVWINVYQTTKLAIKWLNSKLMDQDLPISRIIIEWKIVERESV